LGECQGALALFGFAGLLGAGRITCGALLGAAFFLFPAAAVLFVQVLCQLVNGFAVGPDCGPVEAACWLGPLYAWVESPDFTGEAIVEDRDEAAQAYAVVCRYPDFFYGWVRWSEVTIPHPDDYMKERRANVVDGFAVDDALPFGIGERGGAVVEVMVHAPAAVPPARIEPSRQIRLRLIGFGEAPRPIVRGEVSGVGVIHCQSFRKGRSGCSLCSWFHGSRMS